MTENPSFLMGSSKENSDLSLRITPSAVKRLQTLLAEETTEPKPKLRIRVDTGGCSGFQYAFGFDDKATEEDIIFTHEDVAVVVDEPSLQLLSGSALDYVEDLIGAAFVLKNPNASASCGCGNSFSIV